MKRRNQNIYDISYQPQVIGEHQVHILIEEHPILNSPFTVTVLPSFTAPANIIGGLKGPWGVAVREGGEVVVAEYRMVTVYQSSVEVERRNHLVLVAQVLVSSNSPRRCSNRHWRKHSCGRL